jgi:uncharacterized repeat protein (TIGR03943 family)
VLIGISLPLLWRVLRGTDQEEAPVYAAADADAVVHGLEPGSEAAAEHAHGMPRVAWLLALPLLVAYLVAPPALGAFAADQAGGTSRLADAGDGYPPLEVGADGVAEAQISDVVRRSLYDAEGSLDDVPVRLVGFVVPQEDGRVLLTRFVIACCAADGTPAQVDLELPPGEPIPERDAWVEVVATYESDNPGAPDRPRFTASSITPIATPEDPYEI